MWHFACIYTLKMVHFCLSLNKSFSYQFSYQFQSWILNKFTGLEAFFQANLNGLHEVVYLRQKTCYRIISKHLVNFMVCLLPGNIKLIIRKEESHWHMPMYHVHIEMKILSISLVGHWPNCIQPVFASPDLSIIRAILTYYHILHNENKDVISFECKYY